MNENCISSKNLISQIFVGIGRGAGLRNPGIKIFIHQQNFRREFFPPGGSATKIKSIFRKSVKMTIFYFYAKHTSKLLSKTRRIRVLKKFRHSVSKLLNNRRIKKI